MVSQEPCGGGCGRWGDCGCYVTGKGVGGAETYIAISNDLLATIRKIGHGAGCGCELCAVLHSATRESLDKAKAILDQVDGL